jgi:glycosyltransferase involved in cell wall biosynthesis
MLARLPGWMRPRIGRLQHHHPRPLQVPAGYSLASAPVPAPTISLVTPSFQQGRFLERTIYSVVSQRYPALEYTVQDGGSSDETGDVLREFAPFLTRWVSDVDTGQADAINRGFESTTGSIMAWLNSDDLLLPGSLPYIARYFVQHPEVDVVYGHRLLIDESDARIGAWVLPAHSDLALVFEDYIPQETLFWRRRIWDAAGGHVDTDFQFALDWDLLLRFRDAGARMVRLPRYLGAFRVHDGQKAAKLQALGAAERARLLVRVHGGGSSRGIARLRLAPYLSRHLLLHSSHRLVDQLPLRRMDVRTRPGDDWLGASTAV